MVVCNKLYGFVPSLSRILFIGRQTGYLKQSKSEIDSKKMFGREVPTRESISISIVNGSMGYMIHGGTQDERDFDTYRPTLQKMIDSFQLVQPMTN